MKDVYENPSSRLRDEIPYLVDLRSDLLRDLETRLGAPLARSRLDVSGLPRRLCPGFAIDGQTLVLLPQEAGPIAAKLLKRAVLSLQARSHDIVDVLDSVVSAI